MYFIALSIRCFMEFPMSKLYISVEQILCRYIDKEKLNTTKITHKMSNAKNIERIF